MSSTRETPWNTHGIKLTRGRKKRNELSFTRAMTTLRQVPVTTTDNFQKKLRSAIYKCCTCICVCTAVSIKDQEILTNTMPIVLNTTENIELIYSRELNRSLDKSLWVESRIIIWVTRLSSIQLTCRYTNKKI